MDEDSVDEIDRASTIKSQFAAHLHHCTGDVEPSVTRSLGIPVLERKGLIKHNFRAFSHSGHFWAVLDVDVGQDRFVRFVRRNGFL